MQTCSKCGNLIEENEAFCANCGMPVEQSMPGIRFEGSTSLPKPAFHFPPLPLIVILLVAAAGLSYYFVVLPQQKPSCGNDVCDIGESFNTCPYDCQQLNNTGCGNGNCTGNETFQNCPADCSKLVGELCDKDGECKSKHCVHGICRLTDPYCGDTHCDENETCTTDCQVSRCGNGLCEAGETKTNCIADCRVTRGCGDGNCSQVDGENRDTCPMDCLSCGDHVCQANEDRYSCPQDCATCGNGLCDLGESTTNCPADCHTCGDHICSTPAENGANCPLDCNCGDDICDTGETFQNCPVDCHCGNDACEASKGETIANCPEDCLIETNCANGIDDDEDNLIDCQDPDCSTFPACTHEQHCNDDIDNDKDGKTDCDDPDCFGIGPKCTTELNCYDHFDNDQDTHADCEDPDCVSNVYCVNILTCGKIAVQQGQCAHSGPGGAIGSCPATMTCTPKPGSCTQSGCLCECT